MTEKIWIRADASVEVGSGHVMRCLSLALVLRDHGADVEFVCRDQPGHMADWIAQRNFPVHVLEGDFIDEARDAQQIGGALSGRSFDWAIVDHYDLGAHWETQSHRFATRVLAIDDVERVHGCDVLLDQNLAAGRDARYHDLVPPHCVRLLGPRYALLRAEFEAYRVRARPPMQPVRRILICFGGSDPTRETEKALRALREADFADVAVDVVVGAINPRREAVQQLCDARPGTRCLSSVTNMAELMASADIVLGAGGGMTWERCALGRPSVVIAVAENQVSAAEATHAAGAHLYLGRSDQVARTDIRRALLDLIGDPELRMHCATASRSLVDGRGAQRVAGVILERG